jgi:hypothetical protein
MSQNALPVTVMIGAWLDWVAIKKFKLAAKGIAAQIMNPYR